MANCHPKTPTALPAPAVELRIAPTRKVFALVALGVINVLHTPAWPATVVAHPTTVPVAGVLIASRETVKQGLAVPPVGHAIALAGATLGKNRLGPRLATVPMVARSRIESERSRIFLRKITRISPRTLSIVLE